MEQINRDMPLEEAWKELEKDVTWDNVYNFLREYLKVGDEKKK